MKKRRLYQFFVAALALAFAGCSHDELAEVNPGNGENNSKDAVYMNVTVQLPVGAGTRSETGENGGSSGGTEVGLDRENKVNSVLLVLADKDNKFIGCAEQTSNLKTNEKNGTATTVQSISKTVLSAYYGVSATNANPELTADKQQINVFIFCNPTTALKELFKGLSAEDETWHDAICTSSETAAGVNDNATIWGGADYQGGFLMSSSKIFTKKLPKKFADWENFTDEETPFKLSEDNTNIGGATDNSILNGTGDKSKDGIDGGAISVERSVARFDFKDASPGNNTYDVVTDPEDDSKYIIQIQLTKMALVNMSKQFYYLRRVSPNGKNENTTLCGTETSANYVVDTDTDDKIGGESCNIIKNNTYADHFNFCLGHTYPEDGVTKWAIDPTAREQWYTSTISDVLKGTEDNPDWNGTTGDYRIWRYVIENTIPDDVDYQVNGISTGIVFKGQMIAVGEDDVEEDKKSSLYKALTKATGNPAVDPILYVFDKQIYVSWTEVRAAAIEQAQGSPLYDAVFGTPKDDVIPAVAEGDKPAVYSNDETSADYLWNAWHNVEGGKTEANLKAFKKAATGNDFTIYESSIDEGKAGYYCYYFYWNRHNDNGNNGIMGPMEFDVVRNNVYKLAVTGIRKLGHPRVTENDPDPVDPENPDEDGDVYLSVSVKVLPWVVRINNIEF